MNEKKPSIWSINVLAYNIECTIYFSVLRTDMLTSHLCTNPNVVTCCRRRPFCQKLLNCNISNSYSLLPSFTPKACFICCWSTLWACSMHDCCGTYQIAQYPLQLNTQLWLTLLIAANHIFWCLPSIDTQRKSFLAPLIGLRHEKSVLSSDCIQGHSLLGM